LTPIELRISEAAALSIVEQADYYEQAADLSLALRWEAAVDAAIKSLLTLPERGAPCRFRSPILADLRWIFVPDFPKHMVFYGLLSIFTKRSGRSDHSGSIRCSRS